MIIVQIKKFWFYARLISFLAEQALELCLPAKIDATLLAAYAFVQNILYFQAEQWPLTWPREWKTVLAFVV